MVGSDERSSLRILASMAALLDRVFASLYMYLPHASQRSWRASLLRKLRRHSQSDEGQHDAGALQERDLLSEPDDGDDDDEDALAQPSNAVRHW